MCDSPGDGTLESFGTKQFVVKRGATCKDCTDKIGPQNTAYRCWWREDSGELGSGIRCQRCQYAMEAYQKHHDNFWWTPGSLVDNLIQCVEEEPESAEWIRPFFPDITK